MHRLPIRQKDNAQIAIVHLAYLRPTTNPPIGLYVFADRRGDGAFNPFVSDHRSIWPESDGCKVGGDLHGGNIAKARKAPNVAA